MYNVVPLNLNFLYLTFLRRFQVTGWFDPAAYDARHARVRPSVMQWELAVRETVVMKPSRLNIVATKPLHFPPPFPSLALIHTSLTVGSDQANWLAEYALREKREVAQHLHFTLTSRQAWWCRATLHLSHSWGCALGQPVRQASALVREGGACHLTKNDRIKINEWGRVPPLSTSLKRTIICCRKLRVGFTSGWIQWYYSLHWSWAICDFKLQ